MISCAEAVRQLWSYLDRDLPAAERSRVEAHLDVCRRCCGEMEFAEELRRFLSPPPADLPDEVRGRLELFLDDLEA